jgi:hypothetical protein
MSEAPQLLGGQRIPAQLLSGLPNEIAGREQSDDVRLINSPLGQGEWVVLGHV